MSGSRCGARIALSSNWIHGLRFLVTGGGILGKCAPGAYANPVTNQGPRIFLLCFAPQWELTIDATQDGGLCLITGHAAIGLVISTTLQIGQTRSENRGQTRRAHGALERTIGAVNLCGRVAPGSLEGTVLTVGGKVASPTLPASVSRIVIATASPQRNPRLSHTIRTSLLPFFHSSSRCRVKPLREKEIVEPRRDETRPTCPGRVS